MRFDVLTIFPEFFGDAARGVGPLSCGLLGRALTAGHLAVAVHNLRDWAEGAHRQVDDAPYGGGPGMVMRVEPLHRAVEALRNDAHGAPRVVLLAPQGEPFRQSTARRYAALDRVLLICGRYEGVDHRVMEHVADEALSIGDYVLAGGEAAALAVIEAVARLVPGAVGNPASVDDESFQSGALEYPQYTRPAEYCGWRVPEELLSGNHARIAAWRRHEADAVTRRRRPDLATEKLTQ